MATGGFQVHDRVGKKLICELCDTKVDTCIYKCLDCEVYMCDICTRAHNRLKETRDHKILKDQHGPLPSSKAESRCKSHPGEDVIFYCHTCVIFICSFCITSNHNNHKCSMIKQASEEMSTELRVHLNNLKDNHITVLRRFENLQTSNQEQHESNVKNIQALTDAIIQEIKNIQSMLIEESEKTTNENKFRLSELQDNVTKLVEELESQYLDFNKCLTSGSDIDKIMARNEVSELLETCQSNDRQVKMHHSRFIAGEIDVTSMKMSFGLIEVVEGDTSDNDFFHTEPVKNKSSNTLSNVNVKDVSELPNVSLSKPDQESAPTTFSYKIPMTDVPASPKSIYQKPVNRKSENSNLTTDRMTLPNGLETPTSRTDLDTTRCKTKKADIVRTSEISSDPTTSSPASPDITLNILSKFKHKTTTVMSICPVSDTTAYLTCQGEYNIDRVNKNGHVQGCIKLDFQDGQIKQQLYTGPLFPVCLCLSSDGHILVTMYDQSSYDVNKTSKSLVTRMTTTGQILTTYEYDNDKRLFILPFGIDENTNKDICVVNRTTDISGHVVILNASGRLKCTYKGQGGEMFDPVRVKCDKFGHIILSDLNKKIHILNKNGQLIKYLMTEKDLQDVPGPLVIDTNNLLWVGCFESRVYIVNKNALKEEIRLYPQLKCKDNEIPTFPHKTKVSTQPFRDIDQEVRFQNSLKCNRTLTLPINRKLQSLECKEYYK
ncbi:hypothetical protein KUTeg_023300 [Tegillarca granosa]|uniref:B box-type domain-containing protein n=1 Tax=Tegillarca granosa TaxID=220873 RepID=A0ABQ9E276_TEGGR|nr:hypothetical protein KUTeg_023300 [Tegillarca granosa]